MGVQFYTLFFIAGAFIGWVLECTFRAIYERKIINSGFLFGPFIPIYGCGALSIYFLQRVIYSLPIIIQISVYTLLVTLLEYLVSWGAEKLFKLKLWDYSHEKFNIHGRVCVKFIFFWLLIILAFLFLLEPLILNILKRIPDAYARSFALIFIVYLFVDLFFSSKVLVKFRGMLENVVQATNMSIPFNDIIKPDRKRFFSEIKGSLNAIFKFPHLGKVFLVKIRHSSRESASHQSRQWISQMLKQENPQDWIGLTYSLYKEFLRLAENTISHPRYQRLKNFKHHEKSVYDHNLTVAWISFRLGKALRLRLPELVRGALLHDFFLYNWRAPLPHHDRHVFSHPKEAYKNALRCFYPLSKIEKDIIIKHMWPLGLVPPIYKESLLVNIVDTIVASVELKREIVQVLSTNHKGKENGRLWD